MGPQIIGSYRLRQVGITVLFLLYCFWMYRLSNNEHIDDVLAGKHDAYYQRRRQQARRDASPMKGGARGGSDQDSAVLRQFGQVIRVAATTITIDTTTAAAEGSGEEQWKELYDFDGGDFFTASTTTAMHHKKNPLPHIILSARAQLEELGSWASGHTLLLSVEKKIERKRGGGDEKGEAAAKSQQNAGKESNKEQPADAKMQNFVACVQLLKGLEPILSKFWQVVHISPTPSTFSSSTAGICSLDGVPSGGGVHLKNANAASEGSAWFRTRFFSSGDEPAKSSSTQALLKGLVAIADKRSLKLMGRSVPLGSRFVTTFLPAPMYDAGMTSTGFIRIPSFATTTTTTVTKKNDQHHGGEKDDLRVAGPLTSTASFTATDPTIAVGANRPGDRQHQACVDLAQKLDQQPATSAVASSPSRACLDTWNADEQMLHARGITPLVYFYETSDTLTASSDDEDQDQGATTTAMAESEENNESPFRSNFLVKLAPQEDTAAYPMSTMYVPIPRSTKRAKGTEAVAVADPVVVDVSPSSMDANVVS